MSTKSKLCSCVPLPARNQETIAIEEIKHANPSRRSLLLLLHILPLCRCHGAALSLQHSSAGYVPGDSPPAGSAPTTSQGGSGNGARADVARTTKEVEHLLENLQKEGVVEINGKIASIIDDEVSRIKGEAARRNKNINGLKRSGILALLSISSVAFGVLMGAEWYEQALYTEVVKRILYGEE